MQATVKRELKEISLCVGKILIKRNDERGTRTPGMQSITGLAIPRHTGLGYLVTKDFKKRVPLNAFYVFNLFQGKGFTETILQKV